MVWFHGISIFARYLMPNPVYIQKLDVYDSSKYCYKSVKIQLNISHLFTQLNYQTVLFQTIQFSISHLFAHSLNVKPIRPIDRTLSAATTLGQSGSGSNISKGGLRIPQSSRITGTLPSVCFIS